MDVLMRTNTDWASNGIAICADALGLRRRITGGRILDSRSTALWPTQQEFSVAMFGGNVTLRKIEFFYSLLAVSSF